MRYVLAFMVFCLTSQLAAGEPVRKPNVVLIVADDLGWRDLGCYGSTFHKTPHIDRLAKNGARFTDFYAACPVCSPTRASILTGRYPQRVNITTFLPGRPDRPRLLHHPRRHRRRVLARGSPTARRLVVRCAGAAVRGALVTCESARRAHSMSCLLRRCPLSSATVRRVGSRT